MDNPVFFIDPDGMEAEESNVDINNVNISSALATNAKKDPEVKVDIGYGRMVSGSKLSIAGNYSIDFGPGSSNNGVANKTAETAVHTELDKQIDEKYTDGEADKPIHLSPYKDKAIAQGNALIAEIVELPLLNEIANNILGGFDKFDMETNNLYAGVEDAVAITDTRRDGRENPLEKPYIYFYRSSFETKREFAHTMLHEFGHVDSYLSGNFFLNYIKMGHNWSAAVHLDELYAFNFAHKHGGRDIFHESNWTHYYINFRKSLMDGFNNFKLPKRKF